MAARPPEGPTTAKFQVSGIRFKDPTGAFAASLDPASNRPLRVGNYLIACSGQCPKDLGALADPCHAISARFRFGVGTYLRKGSGPHSERYIVGPVGLTRSPRDFRFGRALRFGTEAAWPATGTEGEVSLAIFPSDAVIGPPATPRMKRPQALSETHRGAGGDSPGNGRQRGAPAEALLAQ